MKAFDRVVPAFLALLRAGLWEKSPEDLSCFPLTDREWTDLLSVSVRQTVSGIVWQGLHFLPDRCLPPVPVLTEWVARTDGIERRNRHMNVVLGSLYAFFGKNGIRPVLVKGQGTAMMYERPLLRECGDIDFYFEDRNDDATAVSLMEKAGCAVKRLPDGSIYYSYKGLIVEHHARLLDLYSPFLKRYIRELEDGSGFLDVPVENVGGESIRILAPELNVLMLSAHILKHATGRGIGIRQMCDMARTCFRLYGSLDMERMEEMFRKTGLERWSRVLNAFMVNYLGLPPETLPCTGMDNAERLFRSVMLAGNFGQGDVLNQGQSSLKRKMDTAMAFVRNSGFSMSVAPGGTFWLFMDLLAGQGRTRG